MLPADQNDPRLFIGFASKYRHFLDNIMTKEAFGIKQLFFQKD